MSASLIRRAGVFSLARDFCGLYSLPRDSSGLYYGLPFGDFHRQKIAEAFRRAAARFDPELLKALPYVVCSECGVDLLVQPADYGTRRFRRRTDTVPADHVVAGDAALGHGGHVGQAGKPGAWGNG